MLKRKALNKILITTFTVFVLLTVYLIPNKTKNNKKLDPVITVEYRNSDYRYIYLVNEHNQLVRTNILVKSDDNIKDRIKVMIEALIISNNDLIPQGLSAIIPKNTKVLAVNIEDNVVYLNFSKEILNVKEKDQEKMIEAISNTILELDDVKGVAIYVDEKNIKDLLTINIPSIITKDFGINKEYEFNSLQNVNKTVIYYINEINNNKYYVPVTRYINDDRDKIKIIVEELSSNYVYEPNLISYLSNSVELINYELDEEKMTLHFNNSIFINDGKILEEVVYTVSYSVFANYNVKEVIFIVENSDFVKKVTKNIE